jgi:hypothetical protein
MRQALRELRHNQWIYVVYTVSLLAPGRELPVLPADQLKPKDVSQWTPEELGLLIEEGRRQSDRQQADLRDIRGRAQWLFTVAVAVLGALGVGLASGHPTMLEFVLWLTGLALLVYGMGGAASVMVSRADFSTIHTAVLSAAQQPIDRALAEAYTRMMAEGENTVATRLTVFRQVVVFCLLGGYLGLLATLLTE